MKNVTGRIPDLLYKLIEEKIIGREFNSVSDYIRDLVRKDLKARGFLNG